MSRYGMQMPGGQARRGASPDIYTGLLAVAFVALAVAIGFVWVEGSKLGKDGNPLGLQESGRVQLAD